MNIDKIAENINNLNNIAEYLSVILVKNKIQVHRYNAYSTNSIYLKLDYGVAYSIRISDHNGKNHLRYRYNVLSTIDNMFVDYNKNGELPMKFYSKNHLEDLLTDVIFERNRKIKKYGIEKYGVMIKEAEKMSKLDRSGFWQGATKITF